MVMETDSVSSPSELTRQAQHTDDIYHQLIHLPAYRPRTGARDGSHSGTRAAGIVVCRDSRDRLADDGQRAVALDHHAANYLFLLTIAAPCKPDNYQKLRVRDMDASLDFWNLMADDEPSSTKQKSHPMMYP
ncbi:hypothetical protein BDZ89DRAFT_1152442 [Hymenopellis radicata]|nr:hypothetical protein BDZ89DRAFT_1152442 [Hymenopellis radicata]